MTAHDIAHGAAAVALVYAATTCLFLLLRTVRAEGVRRTPPFAVAAVLVVTGLITGLQFVFPGLLSALRRTPGALADGQWWRLATPLFVHPDGWLQIAFNIAGIALFGPVVEVAYGRLRFLALYFIPGLVGQACGYAWEPHGAGASVALAGLAGAVLTLAIVRRDRLPTPARLLVPLALAAAVVLTVMRDNHGPPTLVGAGLAAFMCRRGALPTTDGTPLA